MSKYICMCFPYMSASQYTRLQNPAPHIQSALNNHYPYHGLYPYLPDGL
jgi:hypothetical protein